MIRFLPLLLLAVIAQASVIPSDRLIPWVVGSTVGTHGGMTNRPVYAECWPTNTPAQIQALIDAAPAETSILAHDGVYDIRSQALNFDRHEITFRGESTNAIFVGQILAGHDPEGAFSYSAGYFLSVTNGATKGSTNITLPTIVDTNAVTITPGDTFTINADVPGDELFQFMSSSGEESARVNRNLKQMIVIMGVSGNTLEFTPPLAWDFTNDTRLIPKNLIGHASGKVRFGLGFENFTLTTTNSGMDSTPTYMFHAAMLRNCWFSNCVFMYGQNYNVYLEDSVNVTFAHNQVRYAKGSGPNHSGIIVGNDSGCLFEDNILADGLQPAFEWNDGFVGNAFFGNFITNCIQEVQAHNTHMVMNLWEGNVMSLFNLDGYYGSTSHQTLFRNRVYGTVAFKRWNTYENAVGNVIGGTFHSFIYEPTNSGYGPEYGIFELGYPNIGNAFWDGTSGPNPWNWPGTGYFGIGGEWVTNGIFVATNTQTGTTITGLFTNTPQGDTRYSQLGQDSVNTNVYHYIGVITNWTTNSATFSSTVTISNGWRIFAVSQAAWQWRQDTNKLTDILTGNAVCTNESTFTTVWDDSGVQTMPNSYLYDSTPSWWGTNRWPAMQPESGTPMAMIPAQQRYFGISSEGPFVQGVFVHHLNVNRAVIGVGTTNTPVLPLVWVTTSQQFLGEPGSGLSTNADIIFHRDRTNGTLAAYWGSFGTGNGAEAADYSLTPTNVPVVFTDGASTTNLLLNIKGDGVTEEPSVVYVTLLTNAAYTLDASYQTFCYVADATNSGGLSCYTDSTYLAGTVYGTNTCVKGHVLRLSDADANYDGSFIINDFYGSNATRTFSMDFDMRIDNDACNNTKGVLFGFGNIPDGVIPNVQSGILTNDSELCFASVNTANNTLSYVETSNVVTSVSSPHWCSTNLVHVRFQLNIGFTVSLKVDGTNVFTGITSTYTNTVGRYGFYTSTGANGERVWIDNLAITNVTAAGTNVYTHNFDAN